MCSRHCMNAIGSSIFNTYNYVKLTNMKVQKPNDQRSNVKNPNNPQYAADLKNRIRIGQRKLSSMQNKNENLMTEIKSMQKELSKIQKSQKGGKMT